MIATARSLADRFAPERAPRSLSLGGEGVLHLIALGDDLRDFRFAVDGPSNGFLHRAIAIVLNLFVVRGVPVNERVAIQMGGHGH